MVLCHDDNGKFPFDLIPYNALNNRHVSYLKNVYENVLLWPKSNGIQRKKLCINTYMYIYTILYKKNTIRKIYVY